VKGSTIFQQMSGRYLSVRLPTSHLRHASFDESHFRWHSWLYKNLVPDSGMQLSLEDKEATNETLQFWIQISVVDLATAVMEGHHPSRSFQVTHVPQSRAWLISTERLPWTSLGSGLFLRCP